jgi:hypothetical protein
MKMQRADHFWVMNFAHIFMSEFGRAEISRLILRKQSFPSRHPYLIDPNETRQAHITALRAERKRMTLIAFARS